MFLKLESDDKLRPQSFVCIIAKVFILQIEVLNAGNHVFSNSIVKAYAVTF